MSSELLPLDATSGEMQSMEDIHMHSDLNSRLDMEALLHRHSAAAAQSHARSPPQMHPQHRLPLPAAAAATAAAPALQPHAQERMQDSLRSGEVGCSGVGAGAGANRRCCGASRHTGSGSVSNTASADSLLPVLHARGVSNSDSHESSKVCPTVY